MNRYIALTALALMGSSYSAQAADETVLAAAQAPTAAQCESYANLNYVQRQIVDKAAQGVRPLVQYMHRTRMIHQLDATQTIAWLDERREMRQACAERKTALSPSDTSRSPS